MMSEVLNDEVETCAIKRYCLLFFVVDPTRVETATLVATS